MSWQTGARTAARVLVLGLLVSAPLALGRLEEWESAALLLAGSFSALLWMVGGGCLPGWRTADWLLVAGLAGSVLATARSVYLYGSLLTLSLFTGGLLVLWVTRACLSEKTWNRAGWWFLLAGGVLAGLWGAREYTTNALLGEDPSWRAFGPFYNPNCLGGYMALLLAVPLALLLGAQTRARVGEPAPRRARTGRGRAAADTELPPRYPEIAALTGGLVLGLALLCTGSKGGLLAGLLSVVVFAALGADRRTPAGQWLRRGALALLPVAVLGALAFPPVRNRITNLLSAQQGSSSFRLYTWQGTAAMVAARPLTGFGPGTFAHAYPRYARAGFTRQAHQTPLQLAAECGIPTAVLWLAGVTGVLMFVARAGASATLAERLLAAAAVGGGVGLWAHNLVDYTWYLAAHQAAFWALLGLAWGEESFTSAGSLGRWHGTVTATVLVALAVWSTVVLWSEGHRTAAVRMARAGADDAARRLLARVLPLDAHRWVELSRLAARRAATGDETALREAIALRERAAALQPTEVTNLVALSRLFASAGDLPQALRAGQQAVEVYPTSTEALVTLAGIQERMGQEAEALDTYRRVAALYDSPVRRAQAVEFFADPNYAVAWAALAHEAGRRGARQEVLTLAGRAVRLAAEFVRLQRAYRPMLEIAGKFDPELIRHMTAVADESMALLRPLAEPMAALRVGLGQRDLERAEEGVTTLQALAERLESASDPGSRGVRALALAGLADCLRASGDLAASESTREQARALAGKVWPELTANPRMRPAGWDEEDDAALRDVAQ